MSLRYLTLSILLLTLSVATGAGQGDSTISVHGIGRVRLCQPLSSVRDLFPLARDTIMEEEELKWPAKIVPLHGNQRLVFEASWIDTSHVWRLSTSSPDYRTPHGYRVGMTLGYLRDKHEALRFGYAEGYIVVTIVSDQVDFLPDDSTARAFLRRSPRAFDSLEDLPRRARIKELFVSGDCRQ